MAVAARFLLVSTLIFAINVAVIIAMANAPELQTTVVEPDREVLPPAKLTDNFGKQPHSETPWMTTVAPAAVVVICPTTSQLQNPQVMKPSYIANSQQSADHEQQLKPPLSSMEELVLDKPIFMVHDHGVIDHPEAEPAARKTEVGLETVSAGEEHNTENSKENPEGDDKKKHHAAAAAAAAGIPMNRNNAEGPGASRRFGKHHHGSSDKSIAGGGVILGGLATTFVVSIFCYIRATRRRSSSKCIANGELANNGPVHPIVV